MHFLSPSIAQVQFTKRTQKLPHALHYIIPRCFSPLPVPIPSHVPLNFHETLALNPFSCFIASSAAHPGARSHSSCSIWSENGGFGVSIDLEERIQRFSFSQRVFSLKGASFSRFEGEDPSPEVPERQRGAEKVPRLVPDPARRVGVLEHPEQSPFRVPELLLVVVAGVGEQGGDC